MPTLRLYLLGTLEIHYGDDQLPRPPTLKSQSLLAYLVLHRHRPQTRDRLIDLFWGDRPERRARHSLRTALWHIRRCLPEEELIVSDPHRIQFDPESDLWLDVDEFEFQVSHDDIARLQAAVALYRGDFLDGFYDEWVMNERYRLESLFSEALARLMIGQEARREHRDALSTAFRLVGEDPLREDAHRVAMRAYCALGQRNAALEQYWRCREIVLEELGAEPMVETSQLYREILEGRFRVEPVPEVVPAEVPAAAPQWIMRPERRCCMLEPSRGTPPSTFVVRYWRERSVAGPRWRGRIEHIQSGETTIFLDVDATLDFLRRLGIIPDGESQAVRRQEYTLR